MNALHSIYYKCKGTRIKSNVTIISGAVNHFLCQRKLKKVARKMQELPVISTSSYTSEAQLE